MVEILRSTMSLSLGMTLFGARQLGSLLLADTDRATAAFDATSAAARGEVDDRLMPWLDAGERLQTELAERLLGVFTLGQDDPLTLALALIEGSTELLETVPGQALAGRSVGNKIAAFRDFHRAMLDTAATARGGSLADRVEAALGMESYRALWTVEGLGFGDTERGRPPSSLPELLATGALPRRAMIPLHTGMGLSLARRALAASEPETGDGALEATLERFWASCRRRAAPGCELMAFEALGLVVRQLHPHLLLPVDRALMAIDRELQACFWHGVGRAISFAPSQVWCPLGSGLEAARLEPPHALGRGNALAGWAWAFTLVNLRHPALLEGLLREHGERIFDRSAFGHGVGSAILVWYDTHGWERHLGAFLDHRPEHSLAALWRDLVTAPARQALGAYPQLARDRALERRFRYRPEGWPEAERGAETLPAASALRALGRGLDGWVSRSLQAFGGLERPIGDAP